MFRWIKEKWLLSSLVFVLILVLTYIYFPRDLEKKMGIKDVSIEDIAFINLSIPYHFYKNSLTSKTYSENNITDKKFIEDVLSYFRNHSMRVEVFPPNYTINEPNQPAGVMLSIVFKQSNEYTIIYIDNQTRRITFEGTNYLLYGDGIDAYKIWELAQQRVD